MQTSIASDGSRYAAYLDSVDVNLDLNVAAEKQCPASLWEVFLLGKTVSNGGRYLGRRPYEGGPYVWYTYDTVHDKVVRFAAGLDVLGLKSKECIGVYLKNRPEWIMTDLACSLNNYVSVPIYDTLGDDAIVHIMNQTEMRFLVATKDKLHKLCSLQDRLEHLEIVIVVSNDNEDVDCRYFGTYSFESVVDMGKTDQKAPVPTGKWYDVATICYTSGTTGMPKGVVLTNGNLMCQLSSLGAMGALDKLFSVTVDDVHISYLPLAHIFERVLVHFVTKAGAQIGFYSGNVLQLTDDMKELQPTIFASVPRLYNRIYDKIIKSVAESGRIKQFMFRKAMNTKLSNLENGIVDHALWDRLVFEKTKKALGGKVRVMITGAAPIGKNVLDFLRIAFGAEVYEGYGQTETAAGLTVTLKGDLQSGHVGIPISCCRIKMAENGEILVKGAQVFREYYKEPEKTREAFTEDGWYKTGDVGKWDDKGRLVVVDRVKSMFKLSQGEYVAPEKVETIIKSKCLDVSEVFVTGDPLQSYPVAIVVCENRTCADKELTERIQAVCRENGLHGFEIPQKIHILTEPFPEHLFTPTFKLKRTEAKTYFDVTVACMYQDKN